MSDDKTEQPTEHKLKTSREKGEVARSQDVAVAAAMLAVLITLRATAHSLWDHLQSIFALTSDLGQGDLPIPELLRRLQGMLLQGVLAFAPLPLAGAMGAFVGLVSHVGFVVAMEAVAPKPEKLDPAAGVKRLFSLKSLLQLLMMVLKATVIGVALWIVVRHLLPLIGGAAYQSVPGVGAIAWESVVLVLTIALGVFGVLAPVDFMLQKYLFIKGQRMSKDEVKREHKSQEGDPQLKGQRRQIMRENVEGLAPRKAVASAQAVVVNTHYAVAIRYVADETGLPIILAKGVDGQALHIRRLARELGVPIFANPPLARALHKVPLGQTIPPELFESVAAVLRWVERLASPPAASAASSASSPAGPLPPVT
jgi:type III secretion protein U